MGFQYSIILGHLYVKFGDRSCIGFMAAEGNAIIILPL